MGARSVSFQEGGLLDGDSSEYRRRISEDKIAAIEQLREQVSNCIAVDTSVDNMQQCQRIVNHLLEEAKNNELSTTDLVSCPEFIEERVHAWVAQHGQDDRHEHKDAGTQIKTEK